MANTRSVVGNGDIAQQSLAKQVAAAETVARQKEKDLVNSADKVKVTGSPMYRPYFGANMPISINGVIIYLPMDGQTYEIPKAYADEYYRRIHAVDEQERIVKGMANVKNNYENYAGELNLIKRV